MSGVLCAMLGAVPTLALGISLSPGDMYKSRSGPGAITSNIDTATASGGTGPYTYAWTYVSGSSFTITAPSTAATAFSTTLTASQYKNGTYRCTATDSLGATAAANAAGERGWENAAGARLYCTAG